MASSAAPVHAGASGALQAAAQPGSDPAPRSSGVHAGAAASRPEVADVPFSELVRHLDADDVSDVYVGNSTWQVVATDPEGGGPRVLRAQTNAHILSLYMDGIRDLLLSRPGLRVWSILAAATASAGAQEPSIWWRVAAFALPSLYAAAVGGGLYYMLFAREGENAGQRAQVQDADSLVPPTTFADVAGIDEPMRELAEVVEFLREPERFASVGARCPRGVLLYGAPGTGKTLLARALAGEAGVPFFFVNASEFVELYVGRGAARVRNLFANARRHAPCIVYIDEIDAVGRTRAGGNSAGGLPGDSSHEEREQTLNALLVELDGFDSGDRSRAAGDRDDPSQSSAWRRATRWITDSWRGRSSDATTQSSTNAAATAFGARGVVVVASTNRVDTLDAALTRPGRFDRIVHVPAPDARGRAAILQLLAERRRVPIDAHVDWPTVANLRGMERRTGAALEAIVNEAAVQAVRQGKSAVDMACLEAALRRV